MHDEDQQMLSQVNLPGFSELAQNLIDLTKQLRERETDSTFRTAHFAVDVVIRRVRRHIEHLLTLCTDIETHENNGSVDPLLEDKELELLRLFMRSQMYQEYRDDHLPTDILQSEDSDCECQSPMVVCAPQTSRAKQMDGKHGDWKEAATILFRIAMTGVNDSVLEAESPDSNNALEPDKKTEKEISANRFGDTSLNQQTESQAQDTPVRLLPSQSSKCIVSSMIQPLVSEHLSCVCQ